MFGNPISYDMPLYRPPSEAESLLIQVTLGCSHNLCTYCGMYRGKKYRERSFLEIQKDIVDSSRWYEKNHFLPQKAFLCDGDALNAPTSLLLKTVEEIKKYFPQMRRLGIYATSSNILRKSEGELKELVDVGLSIAYLGLESGSDKVLKLVVKGNTAQEMLEAIFKVKSLGWQISMIVMLGLGGRELSGDHCLKTAEIISQSAPDFLSFLTTTVIPDTPYDRMIKKEKIHPLTHLELLMEMQAILSNVRLEGKAKIIFRANHVSNHFPLGGILPRDLSPLMTTLSEWIKQCPEGTYPVMDYRRL